MKITKQKLKQIIKEEISKVLNETSMDDVHKIFMKYDLPEEEEHLVVNAARQAVLDNEYSLYNSLSGPIKAAADELIALNRELRKGLAGETDEKTRADYEEHPEWFN